MRPKDSKLSESHKINIAKSQTGDRNSFYGRHHTEESNEKRREWNRLHPPSPEAREKQKISLAKTNELKRLAKESILNKN